MTTLKDIARRLDLSITQVSRALNGHSDVNEETRLRVQEAARQLNYQPNISARKLVSGRSGMVALVIANHPGLASDTNFMEVVAGLSTQFSGRGMQFVLHIAQNGDDLVSAHRKLVSGGALDGFVLTDPTDCDPRVTLLKDLRVPFVVHGRAGTLADYPYFDIDNYRLAHDLTRHLAGHGHRRIAFINGLEGRTYVTSRTRGYHDALRAAGVEPEPHLLRHGLMDEAQGLLSTVRLFSEGRPPTGIVCGNILIAKGVYRALEALRLSVPRDVSVVAHDDQLPSLRASAFFPSLTVTKSPLRDSWAPLVEFLVGALDGRPLAELQQVADYQFIARNSVASPPV